MNKKNAPKSHFALLEGKYVSNLCKKKLVESAEEENFGFSGGDLRCPFEAGSGPNFPKGLDP